MKTLTVILTDEQEAAFNNARNGQDISTFIRFALELGCQARGITFPQNMKTKADNRKGKLKKVLTTDHI